MTTTDNLVVVTGAGGFIGGIFWNSRFVPPRGRRKQRFRRAKKPSTPKDYPSAARPSSSPKTRRFPPPSHGGFGLYESASPIIVNQLRQLSSKASS